MEILEPMFALIKALYNQDGKLEVRCGQSYV